MKPSNRREFLKHSTAASVSMATAGFTPRRIFAKESNGFHRVVYRELGSTGCKVSEVGLGAARIEDAALVEATIDAGINFIDTAHSYDSEKIIGQVMKTKRDKVFLATKIIVVEKSSGREYNESVSV